MTLAESHLWNIKLFQQLSMWRVSLLKLQEVKAVGSSEQIDRGLVHSYRTRPD